MRQDRCNGKDGGVLALYRDHLQVKHIETGFNLTNDTSKNSYELLCIDFYDGNYPIRFVCVYIPPVSTLNSTTVENLCATLLKLNSLTKPVIFLGDFNLPHIDWTIPISKSNLAHDIFLDFYLNNNLTQQVNEPTHIKGNILDLVLCNAISKTLVLSTAILNLLCTTCDHNIISFKVLLKNKFTSKPKLTYTDYKNANFTLISNYLSSINWFSLLSSDNNLQNNYDNFIFHLNSCINSYVPVKFINKNKGLRKPKQISTLLKQKLKLYKKLKSDKSIKTTYKEKSIEYDRAVNAWFNKIENEICKNPHQKSFFNYVNKKLKTTSNIPPLYNKSNTLVFSDLDKANLLNSYFQQVFTTDNGINPAIPARNTLKMQNFKISCEDVFHAVQNQKGKISRTPEGIPTFFIKRIIASIINPLTLLFNYSIQSSKVSSQWKKAFVIPIYKKGDRSNPSNYRPISLTSSFCRIFEYILFDKILFHLSFNNLITPYQFGFLPGRSSSSQLLSCLHDWYKSLSDNKLTNVIYMDISKAFDSVSHLKLLKVLSSYGINTNILNWIQNFLSGRTQQVALGNELSSSLSVISGVPQGSVLGPLLFLIYINDLTASTSNDFTGGISLFADDTKVYSTNIIELQNSLHSISSWLNKFQLDLAPKKCFNLQIGKTRKENNNCNNTIFINNVKITTKQVIKDLGVFISYNLKWEYHINYIVKIASSYSYLIFKSFNTSNIWILIKLYKTYVRSKLEYNTVVWSPYLLKDINKIEKIQKRFTKLACCRCLIRFSNYKDRLTKLNLKSLQHRRLIFDLILLYKIINNLSDLNFHDYFKFKNSNYILRSHNLQIEAIYSFKTKQLGSSYFNRVVNPWNSLPVDIVNSFTLTVFKFKINRHDVSNLLH